MRNRKTSETWKDSGGSVVNRVTLTYDDYGNRLTIQDGTGTITDTYDELNRQSTTKDVFANGLTWTYDGTDHVTKRVDSLGGTLTGVYDPAGQLTSKQFSGSGSSGTRCAWTWGTTRGATRRASRASVIWPERRRSAPVCMPL